MNPLQVRMRPDLVLAAHGQGDGRYWVVQDPVTLKYFRLREEECLVLRTLDGTATLDQIKQAFERRFAPLRIGARQLHAFLFHLHELGLVVADAPGQGAVLQERRRVERRNAMLSALANPLAIRLPGVAAWPIVEWLYPRVRWMFSPAVLLLCSLLVFAAASLIAVEFGAFQARLPDFWSFFNVRSAFWFAVAMIGVKALHELGHALVCRHFGGSCREFGVLLLVFMPTLYCDVSDAWRLESKWKRIVISSAGMLVELVLASIATLLWWFSEPGLLNAICLRVMFLCSVSTVLFNANPLLRCDGYYILSDLVEVPNLWHESRCLWRRAASRWLLGIDVPDDPTIPRRMRGPLMLYAALSVVYCLLLITGILWFVFRILEPQGLAPLATGLTLLVLAGMAAPPAIRAVRSALKPARRRRFRRGRAAVTLVAALAILALVAFVPLPHRIHAPLWLEPEGAEPVYVSVPGTLHDAVAAGTPVQAGEQLGKLVSPEVELQAAELASEVARLEMQLKNLRLMQADDPSAAPLIPAAAKALDDARERLAQVERDRERLMLRAPAEGTVLPPTALAPSTATADRLAGWQGTPLDPHNRGCYLETGTLVCLVGNPGRLEALLAIEQSEVSLVRVGQRVRVRIEQAPVLVMTGTIKELAKTDAGDLPTPLAHTLDLPMQDAGPQGSRAAGTYYQARIAFDPHEAPLLVGMHGDAKVLADWEPLAFRLWRYVQRTFRLG